MVGLVVTLVVMLAVVALALLAFAGLVLLPVAMTATLAERRGLDPARWSALAVVGVVVAVVVAYALSRVATPLALAVLVAWVPPLVVRSRGVAGTEVPGRHR